MEGVVLPVSDSIDDGFKTPFGPFGLKRFKNEVAFKLYLQRRIEVSVRFKDVSWPRAYLLYPHYCVSSGIITV
jgi:hypothetical protein